MMEPIADTDESITVRMPRGAGLALERAAIGAHSRPAQLARRMLMDGLRASGFDLACADNSAGQRSDFRQLVHARGSNNIALSNT
jgi:hypothetical protein